MEKDLVLNGLRLGEYEITRESVLKKLREEVIAHGMNHIEFCGTGSDLGRDFFLELAKELADNGIYTDFGFHFLKPEDPLGFDMETFKDMKNILGKYFLSNHVAELGTKFGATATGYGVDHGRPNYTNDMKLAKEEFDTYCQERLGAANWDGQTPVVNIDSTNLLSFCNYNGTGYPVLEMCNGNPEVMVPLVRATARALNKDFWATYVAYEWYAGTKTLDPLKIKRLKLFYDFAYMSGSNRFLLESGDECLNAHDTDITKTGGGKNFNPTTAAYGYNHPITQHNRKVLHDFAKFVQEDCRPKGGPKVKVAFVQGNYDGYSCWRAGSSQWNCFDDPNFGYSAPEFVWRIYDELGVKRRWWDVHNFGEKDLSGAPGYGTYDVVPAWAGYEAFSRYEYLIFTGWNSMTEEIYEDLKKYVYNGGKLFMCAAHLNTSTKRNGEIKLIHDGKVSDLFGCDLDAGDILYTNDGVKFIESLIPEVKYPASFNYDPLFSEGYVNYPKVTMTTASPAGRLSDTFWNRPPEKMPKLNFVYEKDRSPEKMAVSVAENKYGKGYTILMTTLDYPSGAAFPTYRNIVREILTASHRTADVQVYGADKLRFTVYEGNKVYLQNTDFDCPIDAFIDFEGKTYSYRLEPSELKPVQL